MMKRSNRMTVLLVSSALVLSPAARAADLGKFDTGTQSSGAFDQLREISGGGSSGPTPGGLHYGESYRAPPPNPRNLPRSTVSRVPGKTVSRPSTRSQESAVNAMVAGMVVMSLLSAMDTADANARAEAEAARARALEEERQRVERLRQAAAQRSAWQARDEAMGNVLAGALSSGTSFFGQPAGNAAAATLDWLANAPAATPSAMALPPEPTWPADTSRLLEKGSDGLQDIAADIAKGIGKAIAPPQLHSAERAIDYGERTRAWVDNMVKKLDPGLLTRAAVSTDGRYTREVLRRTGEIEREALTLGMGPDGPTAQEAESLYQLGTGGSVSASDAGGVAWNRFKSWAVENRLKKYGLATDD